MLSRSTSIVQIFFSRSTHRQNRRKRREVDSTTIMKKKIHVDVVEGVDWLSMYDDDGAVGSSLTAGSG